MSNCEDKPREETEYDVDVYTHHGTVRVSANSESEARERALAEVDFSEGSPFTESPEEVNDAE